MGCIEGSKDAEEERLKKDANKKIEKQIQKDKQIYRATHRLLLLGKLLCNAIHRLLLLGELLYNGILKLPLYATHRRIGQHLYSAPLAIGPGVPVVPLLGNKANSRVVSVQSMYSQTVLSNYTLKLYFLDILSNCTLKQYPLMVVD